MKIALIGYGKMGKAVELAAKEREHKVCFIADINNADYKASDLAGVDTAIEFTEPASVVQNIMKCFDAGIPAIVGTTGWYGRFDEVKNICIKKDKSLFYASNFSIGVNMFYKINKDLAALMNSQHEYEVSVDETHHIHKKDAPSGTAIELAEAINSKLDRKKNWIKGEQAAKDAIAVISHREGEIPGTHKVQYNSEIDSLTIIHEAKNRMGFALGAIKAAEWMQGRKGVFTMSDMLGV